MLLQFIIIDSNDIYECMNRWTVGFPAAAGIAYGYLTPRDHVPWPVRCSE
jgi:hypothetical protein